MRRFLADGVPIRLTGEDVERGTFSHRHAVFHDANTGKVFIPLQDFAQAKASFEIPQQRAQRERGHRLRIRLQPYPEGTGPPRDLVGRRSTAIFINGAQVMLDQFVTSGRAKWGLKPSLVFLLPHRLRGRRAGTLQRPPRALSAGSRRHQPATRQLHDRCAVLSPAAPAGGAADDRSAAAVRADTQESPAQPARRVRAEGVSRKVMLPVGDR